LEQLIKKFRNSRSNLLLLVIITAINVILYVSKSDISFMFSAFAPMYVLLCHTILNFDGAFPSPDNPDYDFKGTINIEGIVFAIAIIAIFFACYLLSKKYRSFILVALILFIVDTLILVWVAIKRYGFDTDMLVNLAFHAWILYYLINGVIAWAKLRKFSLEEIVETEIIMNREDKEVN